VQLAIKAQQATLAQQAQQDRKAFKVLLDQQVQQAQQALLDHRATQA
jgi:hypothetical protein